MRLALTSLLMVLGLVALEAQTTKQLYIDFDGGYAFILSEGRTHFDVGPIKKPHWYSLDYQEHPFILTVTKGEIDAATTIPTRDIGHGNDVEKGWDLSEYVVQVTDDGTVFDKTEVTIPKYDPPLECEAEVEDVNNLFFMATITKITGQNILHKHWRDRLTGRVTLGGGELRVRELVYGCFEYSQNGGKRRQAHGLEGMTYLHGFKGNRIVLNVREEDGDDVGKIVITPKDNQVRLAFGNHHAMGSTPHKAIKHFKHYYWLFKDDTPDHKKQIPTWLGRGGDVTPGEACPPVLFDVQ